MFAAEHSPSEAKDNSAKTKLQSKRPGQANLGFSFIVALRLIWFSICRLTWFPCLPRDKMLQTRHHSSAFRVALVRWCAGPTLGPDVHANCGAGQAIARLTPSLLDCLAKAQLRSWRRAGRGIECVRHYAIWKNYGGPIIPFFMISAVQDSHLTSGLVIMDGLEIKSINSFSPSLLYSLSGVYNIFRAY